MITEAEESRILLREAGCVAGREGGRGSIFISNKL